MHSKPKPHEVMCVVCGKKFLTTHGLKKTCSAECSRILSAQRSNRRYHAMMATMTPEEHDAWKAKGRSRYKRYISNPSVRKRINAVARSRRIDNDKDPEKREARLAKRRNQAYKSGRSHPPKPRLPEEHHRQVRRQACDRWYKKVYTKGKSDFDAGLMTTEAIYYARLRSRIDDWRDENPDKVERARRKCRLNRELKDANGTIDAAWVSVGVFQ